MISFRVRWTKDGKQHVSAVSYDRPSAEDRKAQLEAFGAADVDIVPVKPGE
jgi:hypothetical protein